MKEAKYTEILHEIRHFFERHLMVNEFVAGKMYDFQARENIYSAVVLAPSISSVNGTQLQLSFYIYFIDRLTEDESNANDVFGDELQIALDFISYFTNRSGKWNISPDNLQIEPFQQRYTDIVAGWLLSCSVSIPFYRNVCEIPMRDAQAIPLPPIADFVSYVNGNVVTIINKSLYYSELTWQYDGANVQDLQGSDLVRLEYVQSGTYTITLTAKNEGFPDSICTKTITIL